MFRSLYIHVPFCSGGKCDYCAFASQGHSSPEEQGEYLDALEEEFRRKKTECTPLRSIFIGGGTPSSLTTENLQRLLEMVRRNFRLETDCEWSSEANPESLTPEKVEVLLEGGVNRLSMGVQSFQESLRQRIGRRGTLSSLPDIVSHWRSRRKTRLNLDLIYAIPGETLEEWKADLEMAMAFQPDHLSCYSLILEEGTPLAKRLLPADDDDELFLECWKWNDEFLGRHGLRRYEISNFCRPGCECRHNYEVWHGQTYLGCGPAAVSFDGQFRFANPSALSEWLRGVPPEVDELAMEARRREVLAFGMRTVDGWQWNELLDVTGFEKEEIKQLPASQELLQDGLVKWDDEGLRPTSKGLLFNDQILEAYL